MIPPTGPSSFSVPARSTRVNVPMAAAPLRWGVLKDGALFGQLQTLHIFIWHSIWLTYYHIMCDIYTYMFKLLSSDILSDIWCMILFCQIFWLSIWRFIWPNIQFAIGYPTLFYHWESRAGTTTNVWFLNYQGPRIASVNRAWTEREPDQLWPAKDQLWLAKDQLWPWTERETLGTIFSVWKFLPNI